MDNTVGSLTQFQRSVIIGSLLGDGHLRTFPGRKDALLEVNHSFHQKDYVDWKYMALQDVSASPPKARKGNGKRIAYRFHSKQLPELSEFHRLFYGSGRKAIPSSLVLNPIILAVWFMDDGTRCGTSNFYLNTQQFDVADQKILLEKLKVIDLIATLNRDKIYWRVRFLMESVPRLQALIGNYVIPSMKYKLSYNPVETAALMPRIIV